jgi:hypothetical protein
MARAERENRRTRLRVIAGGPLGHDLPWELLFDPVKSSFLALNRKAAVLRAVHAPETDPLPPVSGPLRVTLLDANVTGQLETERDAELLRELASGTRGRLLLTVVEDVTSASMADALEKGCDLLYFAGTGAESLGGITQPPGTQALAVFRAAGRRVSWEPLDGQRFASWVRKSGARVAVLAACNTDIVARQLAEARVPASVGFRGSVDVTELSSLCSALCRSLVDGDPFEVAVCEARHSVDLRSPGSRQWALATAYLQASTGKLFQEFDEPSPRVAAIAAPAASKQTPAASREWQALVKRKALYEQSLAALERRLRDQAAVGFAVPELEEERRTLEQRISETDQKIATISGASSSK